LTLRADYVAANRYLDLFPLAPRIFGEVWAQEHLKSLDPRFQSASKTLDPDFSGAYDLWVDGAKVEVKAGRAIRKVGKKELTDIVARALRDGDPGTFWMNFQQLKPDYCDAFVFIGVWVDRIRYWVLSPAEAAGNPYYSHQHRDGSEYQIGIKDHNLAEFEVYEVQGGNLVDVILEKAQT
jgi:hypothetical protein